jgi:phospholipid/cholesterol/gamma-HCH transport system permease protein
MRLFYNAGRYFNTLASVFSKPDKLKITIKSIFNEMVKQGLNSMGLVAIISFFMGAVIVIQTASQMDSFLIPAYTVGFASRQSLILEFCPTIVSLILAGKVGSNISSELGTMRISEQIDALEIMGINSKSFLIFPKIIGCMFINPILIVFSMFLGLIGGYIVCLVSSIVNVYDYLYGIRIFFDPFTITYALIKSTVFAFIITSISAYQGYYVKGGAIQVGEASTRGVVYSSILILIFNYILTQLLLI